MKRRRRTHSSVGTVPQRRSRLDAVSLFLAHHADTAITILLIVTVVAVFAPMLDNEFFNDDFRWIRDAREEMTWVNVLTYRVIGFFRPFINVTYWITEKVTPGNKYVYNLTQVLLHLTNTLLVYHLLRRLFRDRFVAGATALFFAVNFNHLGATIWVSGRTSLIAALFLLSAFHVALGRLGLSRRVLAWGLYGLSLASKEEAIVGPILLELLYWIRDAHRQVPKNHSTIQQRAERQMVLGFVIVAAAYLVLRTLVLGHFTQHNYGPGWHLLDNLGGSILGQFWPRLLMALLHRKLVAEASGSVLWPEILALPLVVGFLILGRRMGRFRTMIFALSWVLVSVLPVLFLKFRFLQMQSTMHTRYYYMSCIGSSLAVVLLLVGLWRAKRFAGILRTTAVFLFLGICTQEVIRIEDFEKRFSRGNAGLRLLVDQVTLILDKHPEMESLVIGDSPYDKRYLTLAVQLERPDWPIEDFGGSLQEVQKYRPCVYVTRSRENPQLVSTYILE